MKKYFIFLPLAALLVLLPFAAFGQETNTNANLNTNDESVLILNAPTNDDTNVSTNVPINGTTNTIGNINTSLPDDLTDIVNDPGILPDSPWYFLKQWGEGIHMFVTFNDSKKAELEYTYTLRRYAEVQKLIKKGKTDIAEKQVTKAEQKTKRLQQRIEKAVQVGSTNKDELISKLESLQARHQDLMMSVYNKVPAQAQDSILRAMDNSTQGIQNAIDHVKGSSAAQQFEKKVQTQLENYGQEKKNEVQTKFNAIRKKKGEDTNSDTNEDTNTTVDEGQSTPGSDANSDAEVTNSSNDDTNQAETESSSSDTNSTSNENETPGVND